MVKKPSHLTIVSGGQTGADRAALDWAIAQGIPHGGYCPAGRKAEDGPIPARYQLTETSSTSYAHRTRLNVKESDVTLILASSEALSGGTLLTLKHARKLGKPHLLVVPENLDHAPRLLAQFLAHHKVRILNVAGPRASTDPTIYRTTLELLQTLAKTP